MMVAVTVCGAGKSDAAAIKCLREFLREPWPSPPRPARKDRSVYAIETDDADPMYQSAHERASVRLAELSPEDADLVADNFHPGSLEHTQDLRRIWHEQGRDDLADRVAGGSALGNQLGVTRRLRDCPDRNCVAPAPLDAAL